MIIEPLNSPYPSLADLSGKQRSSYNFIKSNVDDLLYVDVTGGDSYLMLYLNELVKKLLTENLPCNFYADKIKFIKQNYGADFIQDYCTIWLGDIYYYFNDFENAIKSWADGLKPDKIWTLLASKIISSKLHEDISISAREALSYKKNITKYGKNNMDLVIRYVDKIIQQDYIDKIISTDFFLRSNDKRMIKSSLFTGCIFGYDINAQYNSKMNHREDYYIESLSSFTTYVGDVSRRAENAIREDLGMPRIGEGWISETDLYYKIKKHFSSFTVIQHFNAEWLGRQHLDVYIKELNIGIEFHGLQHFQPVEFFGGEEAFIENIKRDKKKIVKCKKHSTKLIIVTDGYDINGLVNEIESVLTTSK